jgi:sulfur carrier protein ThiS
MDALLADTGMTPERVFLAGNGKVSPNEQLVRYELTVK